MRIHFWLDRQKFVMNPRYQQKSKEIVESIQLYNYCDKTTRCLFWIKINFHFILEPLNNVLKYHIKCF